MQIDWKHLATTEGYISLKKAYIRDVQGAAKEKQRGRRPMRDKAVFLKLFNWVIARAKHYAEFTGRPIHEILNEWEAKRDYWWLNYYQECNQPKLFNSPNIKPIGIRGTIKYYKTSKWYVGEPERATRSLQKCLHELALMARTKKAKWTAERKKRGW